MDKEGNVEHERNLNPQKRRKNEERIKSVGYRRDCQIPYVAVFCSDLFCFIKQYAAVDPLHVCGNAANLEDKTKEIFASVKKSYCSVLQIDCIPTDV